jgi:adenine-specific DNA-methyltransferase
LLHLAYIKSMPTLHWIGKEKVINHHLDVPYRVLEHQYSFDNGTQNKQPTDCGNKIIHGDNLEALKSLLPEYEGKIKCIYIDPPYNTGNEGWVYNDNVNDPKIKKWLGQVVGKEAEDLTRHDKWLCMIAPRLQLLRKLLAEDGAIIISIDDNEQANLKLLCDEIFGSGNFVACLPTVMNLKGNQDEFGFAGTHEYTIIYSKNKNILELNNLSVEEEDLETWEVDEIGYFKKGAPIRATGTEAKRSDRPYMFFPILIKNGHVTTIKKDEFLKLFNKEENKFNDDYLVSLRLSYEANGYKFVLPIEDKVNYGRWRWGYNDNTINRLSYDVIVNYTKTGITLYKKQRPEIGALPSKKPKSFFYRPEYSSGNGTNQLKQIFDNKVFQTPKPLELIVDLLQITTCKNSIILDSFAGSGTTAHAVLNLNKQDGGNRKFICIEMEEYAETITAERVKRVIKGYGHTPNPSQEGNNGTGGSFDYYELGPALFNDDNEINELVGVEKLRQYMYYTETKSVLKAPSPSERAGGEAYLLNKHNDTAYYFYYEQDGVTTLNHDFLSTIKTKAEQYVIYADNCLLTKEFMTKHHIIFKKIPRDITKF